MTHDQELPETWANRLVNVRDVARSIPGAGLVPGVLLRGDAPHPGDLDPLDVPWPPATVIDLRTTGEQSGDHPLAATAAVRVETLVDRGNPAPVVARALGDWDFVAIYLGLLDRPIGERMAEIVAVVTEADAPIFIHCAGGKDRTGIVVALILRLCGVDREGVLDDYVLSNDAREGLYERHRARGIALAPTDDGALIAPRDAMAAVLDHWDAHSGGTKGWYLDHGGDLATLTALEARLREDRAPSSSAERAGTVTP